MKDPSDRKVRPRPTCRFFMKGNCLWGLVWAWLFLGLRWQLGLARGPGACAGKFLGPDRDPGRGGTTLCSSSPHLAGLAWPLAPCGSGAS